MLETITYLYENLYEFFYSIFENINNYVWSENFFDINIINGELINIGLKWGDLPAVLSGVGIILLVYLFILFIVKLLGVFVWK